MVLSPAVLLLFAVPLVATAAELPRRKSGLWEIATAAPGSTAGVSAQLCVDRNTDDFTRQLAGAGIPCSKNDIRRESDHRYVIDSVCQIGESTVTSRSVVTGSFDSGYQVNIHAKYSPPLMNMSEGQSTITSKWIGPCRAGQRAGDLILPNGMTLNMFDAPKRLPSK